MIDWKVFSAVSAIFQPYNGGSYWLKVIKVMNIYSKYKFNNITINFIYFYSWQKHIIINIDYQLFLRRIEIYKMYGYIF